MALENYELAIADFEKSNCIQPSSNTNTKLNKCKQKLAEILKEEGNKVFKTGDIKKSIEIYTKSINLHPTSHCYGNRSLANYKLQNYEDSASDATDSLRCDKNYSKGFLRRADAYMALQKYEQAIMDYNYALALNPSDTATLKKIYKLQKAMNTGKEIKLISCKCMTLYYSIIKEVIKVKNE